MLVLRTVPQANTSRHPAEMELKNTLSRRIIILLDSNVGDLRNDLRKSVGIQADSHDYWPSNRLNVHFMRLML